MNFKNHEDAVLKSLIKSPAKKILDLGCGLGRYLIPLTKEGHQVFGIDKNPKIVDYLHSKGYPKVYSVNDADINLSEDFDYIIMSHLIEHIPSEKFVSFFNKYLKYLVIGGKLIIATPLLHKRFFDDYDHIKPYSPKTFTLLFSDYEQFQEKPLHRLKLEYVWIRRDPIEYNYYPGDSYRKVARIKNLNKFLAFLYRISNQKVSEKTGWIGVFTRTS